MAVRFALSSSDWSSGSTWDGFAQLGFPTSADDVYANSYTVRMDTSIAVNSLNNSQTPRVVENIATPAMTSNATPSGFVYASSFSAAGQEPWRAFDQNTGTQWTCGTANTGTLTYEFPTARNIKRYALRASSDVNRIPRQWTFEGSNNNIAFTVLETVTASLAALAVYTSAILANTASFTFYRINISATSQVVNFPQINELELTESTGSGAGNLSGGTFNFNTANVSASVGAGLNAGATNLITVTATTGTVNISAPNATVTNNLGASTQVINHSGACDFIITGSSFNGASSADNTNCINKSSTGTIVIRGTINGAVGASRANNNGLNATAGNTIIIGNVNGSVVTSGNGNLGINQTAGSLTVVGNVNGGVGNSSNLNQGIFFSGTSLTITGSVSGGTGTSNPAVGINVTSAATINISGSVNGANNAGLASTSNAAIILNMTGSVNGSSVANGINLAGAVTLNINGPITGGSGANAIVSTSTSAINRLTGPFITGPTGIQPFYGPKLTIVTGSATYWTFTSPNVAINKTLYSTDLVSGVPSPSNVRQGVTYASGALTGTMIVPSTSSVAFGVPVDTFTGSAIIAGSNYNISNEIWNTPVTSLTGSSTIGERLKNNATVASTGAQIAAMAGL